MNFSDILKMNKIRNNMFYLMDKKELNRNYGEFNGWGSAYNQFENIFETGRGGSVPPKTK
jgi:hypothetical protein